MNYPIRIDLIDRAGTRTGFCNVAENGEAIEAAEETARAAAARFHGTWQTYYEDDPERGVDADDYPTLLFTYGILNDPDLQRRARLGGGFGMEPEGRARALDHRVEQLQPATLVEDPEADAPGYLWWASPADLEIIDRIEGIAHGFYRRDYVRVRVEGKEEVLHALCYKMTDRRADQLRRWNREPYYSLA